MTQNASASDKKKRPSSSGSSRKREAVLICLVVLLAAAAIVGYVLLANATPPGGAAAKVNGAYIYEEDVATWIAQYRASYLLDDDDDWAATLAEQDTSVSTFRKTAIDQLALNALVLERAEELGVTPTDEEAQEQLDATKEALSLGDDDTWQETLESYELSEEQLLEQYKVNLAQDAICEQDVEQRDATDDEVLAYLQDSLAGTTQYHTYRIVFTGDDAQSEATEVYAELQEQQDAGELTTDAFAAAALEYSDADDVLQTAGSYAWSTGDMASEVSSELEDAEAGSLVSIVNVEDDDAYEIVYCDETYTFASADELTELPDDMDDELLADVQDAAAATVYETNCESYLAWLLAQADITYYPVPDDAAYNVDVTYTLSLTTDDDVENDGNSATESDESEDTSVEE